MLHVCLSHQHKSSIHHSNMMLDMPCIFGQTGLPLQVDAWLHYGVVDISIFPKAQCCLAQFMNRTKSQQTCSRQHLLLSNGWTICIKCVFQGQTVQHDPQCKHQTINIQLVFNKLSNAATLLADQ